MPWARLCDIPQTGHELKPDGGIKVKQIIKAQLYQISRGRLQYIMLFITLFLQVIWMLSDTNLGFGAGDGSFIVMSDYITSGFLDPALLSLLFAFVFTAEVCGGDFMNKTQNYEIMSGHKRKEVYCGRAVLSLAVGTIGALVITAFPILVGCMIGEWGDSVSVGAVMLRYGLSIFPIMRMICEFIFLSYVIKNQYIIMALGGILVFGGSLLPELLTDGTACFLGLTSLAKLYHFTSWSTLTLVGEKDIILYDSLLKPGEIVSIITASVLFGGLFLYMGYEFFKKDDLN